MSFKVDSDDLKPFLSRYEKELSKDPEGFIIDYRELEQWNPQIGKELLNRPDYILPIIEKATLNFANEEVVILIKNSPLKIPLQNLKSEYLGKLISVEGIICQVVPTYPMIHIAAYECKKSKGGKSKIIYVPQTTPFLGRPPRCGRGYGTAELLGYPDTTYIDVQDLGIQEKPENLKAGQVPPPVKLRITRKPLINGARAGDIVNVVGILKEMKPSASTRERIWGFYIDVVYIEVVNKDPSDIYITEEEERQIIELATNPEIYGMLIDSIAPSIYGCNHIKEAIIYQLFGGREKRYPDKIVRGTIHILWIDNPSRAKSQISMRVSELALRGVYVAGGGASGAGLTAAVIWLKNKRPLLEAGALVIANQGICCVDEIEKMNDDDRVRIHEAMAQGVVNIQKAGFHYTLPAKTAIFATGNPTSGRYDFNQTIRENISLPSTIISRFDLIFIGKGNLDDSENIASHILRRQEKFKVSIEKELLKKYIAYAKKINPYLTEEAIEHLESFYIKLAKIENPDSPVTITPRQLEALVRISEAHARIRLSNKVERQDAMAAINIMMISLREAGIDPETGAIDIDTILTGVPKSVRSRISVMMDILNDRKEHELSEIYEKMEERGVSRRDTMKILRQLYSDGMVFCPKEGYYRRTR